MNAVEIEEAVSELAAAPFDRETFPFAFLEAFGNKVTTIKRLKSNKNGTNRSDVGGVLQRNNIHIKVCDRGEVTATLAALRESPATAKHKAKFVLATDGETLEAESLADGETIACDYAAFADKFGFFLPLAGITTVRQIRENAFDIKATARLNRLYVELLKDNPEWGTDERREDLDRFMARLIFCFFAEDTNIFHGDGLFTNTIAQMSAADASNVHEVLSELFQAMRTPLGDRAAIGVANWANGFPYVNGGLFSGSVTVPRFSKVARSYLLHVGGLDWTKINPDIFGSMIQAVADEGERGALGMHYTSVPNILKVLNPLFLDDLRSQLETAENNPRKLLNLRQRLTKIRVFDPACGSGNFLVIAYKEMRAIEAEINVRRGEDDRKSEIPLTNFRGIELRNFPCEVARLALIIAEFQCDVLYRGQMLALAEFLPLKNDNWITCGNALRLDWLSVFPATDKGVMVQREDLDLWQETADQAEVNFQNEGGETYICGNPPYLGSKWQFQEQKDDLKQIFEGRVQNWKSLDYVAGWFMKAADYGTETKAAAAFVSTNSICQGVQVSILWPLIFQTNHKIHFAYTSFKWSNLASHNAGVTVAIIGLSIENNISNRLFYIGENGNVAIRKVENISAYLVATQNLEVYPSKKPISTISFMDLGNMPKDGGNLLLSFCEAEYAIDREPNISKFIYDFVGSQEYVKGLVRRCIWIEADEVPEALESNFISLRLEGVRKMRLDSDAASTRAFADRPYRFKQIQGCGRESSTVVPKVTSEGRYYLPVGLLSRYSIVSDNAFALYDAPLWNMALIASRLHLVWIATVCGKLKTDFRYSNTLGWNTFPVPPLTSQNKQDLTRAAENILLAREHYFPATIADMYDPKRMDSEYPEIRRTHEQNDEILERIYIGRRFKNDTERLEKLFDMYTEMTEPKPLENTKAAQKSQAKRKAK